MRKRWVLFLLLFSSVYLTEVPSLTVASKLSTSNSELCGTNDQSECAPVSCIKACLEEGEDPLECPYYCYDQA